MTGQKIKEGIEDIIDDSLTPELAATLMNNIKDYVESLRDWEFLKVRDTSISISASSVYTTAYSLPANFLRPLKIYVGTDATPYEGVPFEEQEYYKDSGHRYFIDYANNQIHFTGSRTVSETVTLLYLRTSTDWDANNLDAVSPLWPSKFHRLIVLAGAEFHSAGADYDEVAGRQSLIQGRDARLMLDAMIKFDAKQKLAALDYSASPRSLNYGKNPMQINIDE